MKEGKKDHNKNGDRMEQKKQEICCSVHDCVHCDCGCDMCQLKEIKVCNCGGDGEKENTMCDSYKEKKK